MYALESGDAKVKEKQRQLQTMEFSYSSAEKKNAIIDKLQDQIESLMYASDFIKEEYMMNNPIKIAASSKCLDVDMERYKEQLSVEAEENGHISNTDTVESSHSSYSSISNNQYKREDECSNGTSFEVCIDDKDESSSSGITEHPPEHLIPQWDSFVRLGTLDHDDASGFTRCSDSKGQRSNILKVSKYTTKKMNAQCNDKLAGHKWKLCMWIKKITRKDELRAKRSRLGVDCVFGLEWMDYEGMEATPYSELFSIDL